MDLNKIEEFYNLLQEYGLEPPFDDFIDLKEEDHRILWNLLNRIKSL